MQARHALLAAVAGFAGFMLATVAITAALEPRIEFSVLVGLPIGILVGLATTWYVYSRLARSEPGSGRVATALVAAAVGFVLGMALPATVGVGLSVSMLVAVSLALVAGLVSYWQELEL